MKFIIKKDILIKALSDTGKVFSMGKVAVPILNNFKFTVEKDFIEILASNGDTTILNKLDVFDDDGNEVVSVESNGEFLISFRITEIVKKLNGETISSTAIRNLLADGNIAKANLMLGYNFSIEGTVIKGQQLGRKIGFRTANITYPPELITVPFGAYSVKVILQGQVYNGVTNIGIRPTVSTSNRCSVETHIIDFNKDIYGEKIRVEFINMLRPEKKFNSLDELKKQIKYDISSTLFD